MWTNWWTHSDLGSPLSVHVFLQNHTSSWGSSIPLDLFANSNSWEGWNGRVIHCTTYIQFENFSFCIAHIFRDRWSGGRMRQPTYSRGVGLGLQDGRSNGRTNDSPHHQWTRGLGLPYSHIPDSPLQHDTYTQHARYGTGPSDWGTDIGSLSIAGSRSKSRCTQY